MRTEHQAAVVYLRMTPQLRDALRDAADHAGTSLNAYAVQVLAAAAGDPSRFRATVDRSVTSDEAEIKRDGRGFPLNEHEERRHRLARSDFIGLMGMELGSKAMFALVTRLDAEDPGHNVRWQRERQAEEREVS
jgi:hypothetical protein